MPWREWSQAWNPQGLGKSLEQNSRRDTENDDIEQKEHLLFSGYVGQQVLFIRTYLVSAKKTIISVLVGQSFWNHIQLIDIHWTSLL